MQDEQAFIHAMQEHPEDATLRLVFADWLEERGDPRGELIRLLHTLTQSVQVPDRNKLEERLRNLVASGVQPVGPFWTNSIGMRFAWIPAGTFLMGSPENEQGRSDDETQHQVTLASGFYLAVYPMTQAAWQKVLSNNPSSYNGVNQPVETISWADCQNFLLTLSKRERQTYRLPTEAEWEYACRAGTTTPYYFGKTISIAQANYDGRLSYGNQGSPSSVGRFPANAWGLYDMHGNVNELSSDWYGQYSDWEVVDPQGREAGERRVVRGGSYITIAASLRSASRGWVEVPWAGADVGFRPVRTFP